MLIIVEDWSGYEVLNTSDYAAKSGGKIIGLPKIMRDWSKTWNSDKDWIKYFPKEYFLKKVLEEYQVEPNDIKWITPDEIEMIEIECDRCGGKTTMSKIRYDQYKEVGTDILGCKNCIPDVYGDKDNDPERIARRKIIAAMEKYYKKNNPKRLTLEVGKLIWGITKEDWINYE